MFDGDVVEVAVDIIRNGVLVILDDVPAVLNRVDEDQIARKRRVDGCWSCFGVDFGPMIGTLDNLFGVKPKNNVRGE